MNNKTMIKIRMPDGTIADQIKVKTEEVGLVSISTDAVLSYAHETRSLVTNGFQYTLTEASAKAFEAALVTANQLCILVGDDGD